MRTLYEIIECTKEGGKLEYDELKYAMLTLESLLNLDHRVLRETLLKDTVMPKALRDLRANNSFNAYKTALNNSPKEWLGWRNGPDNPEYQRFRELGAKLLDRAVAKVGVEDHEVEL